VVLRILDIAGYFYEMNNFCGLKEIYAALDTSSVSRLKVTREKCNLEQHAMYAKFKQLFDYHEKGLCRKRIETTQDNFVLEKIRVITGLV